MSYRGGFGIRIGTAGSGVRDRLGRIFRIEGGRYGHIWKVTVSPSGFYADDALHGVLERWMGEVSDWLDVRGRSCWCYVLEGRAGGRVHAHGLMSMAGEFSGEDIERAIGLLEDILGSRCNVQFRYIGVRGISGWASYMTKAGSDRLRISSPTTHTRGDRDGVELGA